MAKDKPKMNWANRLTLVRIVLVPVLAILLIEYTSEHDWLRYVALAVFAVAAATDLFDGLIARFFDQQTQFGTLLDPIADKMLLNVAYVLLSVQHQLPVHISKWIPVVILGRDVIIVLGAWYMNEVQGPFNIKARISGKITTALQTVSVLAVLSAFTWSHWLLIVTVGFSVVSLADYLWYGTRQVAVNGNS